MRGNRNRDTGPEMALRRELHKRGFRFRLHRQVPPARTYADIVFPRQRVAVFVDGCFWHHCPEHFRPSKKNSDYWATKIARNVARDRLNDQLMKESGWTVVRIWEHEQPAEAVNKIAELLSAKVSD